MDFNTAIKTLDFYLSDETFLQKISSLQELTQIETPVISLLLTKKGNTFLLPDEILFRRGISFQNDDWVDFESLEKERKFVKQMVKAKEPTTAPSRSSTRHTIKSSCELYENLAEGKIIKSGYWNLFKNVENVKFEDSILILNKDLETLENMVLLVLRGPLNNQDIILPEFLNYIEKTIEFSYQTTPHSIPPIMENFLSYRSLQVANKLGWDTKQVTSYLGSIWNERNSSTIFSRINLLFESAVLLVEKSPIFNKGIQENKEQSMLVSIPSNFVIGICGGYARGEYSDTSDMDMLLIHEGNDQQFLQAGEALHHVLQYTPNLELCKLENLANLNFHENTIPNILQSFLHGEEHFLNPNQRLEVKLMLESIETLRKTSVSIDERRDGIRKYCWSIYKSIINMVPIYEKPIGKGQFLRSKITHLTRNAIHEIIPILLRITESLKDDNNALGENLRICQPFLYDSIYKTYSVITALQDLSTILAVVGGAPFTSSTSDRFKMAVEQKLVSKEQGRKLIEGYTSFSSAKYKLTKDMPIEAVEFINEELKSIIKEVYNDILQNVESREAVREEYKITYPLVIFSDLHWGLNNKLAKKCLAEIKKTCDENQVRSILVAGDVFNVDRVTELTEIDSEGIALLNGFSDIQDSLGDQRIHVISGNHDPDAFYRRFSSKLERELDIHYLGDSYKDDNIWVEHGDQGFWNFYKPPLDNYILKYREENNLSTHKIIVGHYHRIYEEENSSFYANGTIGKFFSAILVNENSIEVIRLPVEYTIDFEKINKEYEGIINADIAIIDYIQENFALVEWDQDCSNLQVNQVEKKTLIIVDKGVPTGFIPFNKVEPISKLKNIQVYEVAFPINYTFATGQTLKEAWGIFSITGESILPVMDEKNQIVGTLSIFSVPKPEKEHAETKEAEIDDKMKSVGDSLIEKLIAKKNDQSQAD